MELQEIRQLADRIKSNITKVIVGKEDTIELVLISLICSGHVLIEDVPGVGKTMLAKCLARSVDCDFKRIQFTPDLLPSDITGINYYDQKQGGFVFRPGPLFANIILADEINRATPRTQFSLLECMEEGQVTVDGNATTVQQPFFVMYVKSKHINGLDIPLLSVTGQYEKARYGGKAPDRGDLSRHEEDYAEIAHKLPVMPYKTIEKGHG